MNAALYVQVCRCEIADVWVDRNAHEIAESLVEHLNAQGVPVRLGSCPDDRISSVFAGGSGCSVAMLFDVIAIETGTRWKIEDAGVVNFIKQSPEQWAAEELQLKVALAAWAKEVEAGNG